MTRRCFRQPWSIRTVRLARSASALGSIALAATLCSGCGRNRQLAAQPPVQTRPSFSEIADKAGIRFVHQNGQGAAANIVETTGTGCGVFDYDNDGWLDIFLVNGKSSDGNHLYHNDHNGTFTDVTAKAGVAGLGHGFGVGCAAADYDGDGWLDLYVANYGKNILFHNMGDGTFRDVTAKAGVSCGGFSTASVMADLDGDGRPDLYVARYCEFTPASKQLCIDKGVPASCPPYFYPPEPDIAFKNMGDGTFRDMTAAWGLKESSGRGLGIVAIDYNGDHRLDLFVTNDGSPNFLYQNLGGGRFKSVGAVEGIALTDAGAAVANMGTDFGDFMGDGTFGAMTGVFEGEEKPLWKYDREMGFQYVTRQSGIGPVTQKLLTWGVGFADMDNDGLLDILQVNGHVQDRVQEIKPESRYRQPRTFLKNVGGGKFEDRTSEGGPALTTPAASRGAAFGDLFNDGGIDVVVNNNNSPAMLIRNDMPRRHFAELRLLGNGRQWEAVGAVATLEAGGKKQTRFVHTSYSFASANDPRLHFGLGDTTRVDRVTVTWPDGKRSEHADVSVDRITTIVEPGAKLPEPVKRLLDR